MNLNPTIPIIDVLLIRNSGRLKFQVYRKPICKSDNIHHKTGIKRWIIIDFYLRAFHICSQIYLDEKFNYRENIFLNLRYYKPFIHFIKSKAHRIHCKNRSQAAINTLTNNIKLTHKHIILLNNSSSNSIENNFNNLGIKSVTLSSKTVRGVTHFFIAISDQAFIVFHTKTVNWNILAKRWEIFINVYMNIKEILD